MSRAKLRPIDVEHLSSLFDYFPETGLFLRKSTNKITPGIIHKPSGYRYLTVIRGLPKPINIWAHRAARALYDRADPYPFEIDHINRIKDDNRIINLRLAAPVEQALNRYTTQLNTVGTDGYQYTLPLHLDKKQDLPHRVEVQKHRDEDGRVIGARLQFILPI